MSKNIIVENYWLHRFSEPVTPLQLGMSRGKGSTRRLKRILLPEGLMTRIREITGGAEAGRLIYGLSAWAYLLSVYSGNEEVIVVTPELGAGGNLCLVRGRLRGELTVRELLKFYKDLVGEALRHSGYAYRELVEKVRKDRGYDLSVLLEAGYGDGALQDLSELPVCGVMLRQEKEGSELVLEYGEWLGEDYASRLGGNYVRLLEWMAEHGGAQLREFEVLPYAEALLLSEQMKGPEVRMEEGQTVVDVLRLQALQHWDRICIKDSEGEMTYGDLEERSNRLSRVLVALGVGRDELVPVCMQRGREMMVAILGIWKAGGGYVPVDPSYPDERINYILEDTQAKVWVSAAAGREGLGAGLRRVTLDDEEILAQPGMAVERRWDTGGLAYVIYTSGSTGLPKGAMIEHGGMLNHLYAKVELLGIDERSRIAQNAKESFDISVWQMWTSLMKGGEVVVYDNGILLSVEGFIRKVAEDGITVLEVVPSYLTVLLDTLEETGLGVEGLGMLRWLLVTGEELKGKLVERWKARYGGIRMVNAYGPTEASDDITHYCVGGEMEGDRIPVGRVIRNMRIYIMDDQLRMCPVGVKGEICVSGAGVGRGYWRDEERSKAVFKEDPYLKGVRMYRTGDVGRWREDGNVEYYGRRDHQVKIRGHRVELGEIEYELMRIAGVKESVVVDREDEQGNKYLIGYVVREEADGKEAYDWRRALEGRLPLQLIPREVVELQRMPLTENGKIDRRKLPEPKEEAGAGMKGDGHRGPSDEVESALAEIWKEVLGLVEVGVSDNFFELGGHSLKATQVASRVRKRLGVRLEIQTVFEYPTIEALGGVVKMRVGSSYIPIQRVSAREQYEISNAQRRIWIIDQLSDNKALYNISQAYEIDGTLNRPALENAYADIVQRHESLRTLFADKGEEGPCQVIGEYDEEKFRIAFSDISAQPDGDLLAGEAVLSASRTCFHLEKGPLLSVCVIQRGSLRHLLVITMHHIISDGWSMEVFIKELLLSYNYYSSGQGERLADLKVQYKDYVHWQGLQLMQPETGLMKQYWLDRFRGEIPRLDLPLDRQRGAVKKYRGSSVKVILDKELSGNTYAFSRHHGVSLFMTLLAAVNALLYKHTGQKDIVVGTPVAGREHPDLEGQIGLFINTLPLRTKFNDDLSFSGLLEAVRQCALEAYANQAYPFDRLVEDLALARDPSRSPLFDAMIILNDARSRQNLEVSLHDIRVRPFTPESLHSEFDVCFQFNERDEHIELNITYDADLFVQSTMQLLASRFCTLLRSALQDSGTPLESLQCIGEEELHRLLVDFNDTFAEASPCNSILEMFERQAECRPDAISVVHEDRSLTFRQLDQWSNQVANFLITQHRVSPGDIIGLEMERTEWMIAGILGILKSGAAYLPVDPAYPASRKIFMLQDAGAKVLIADKLVSADSAVPGIATIYLRDVWRNIAHDHSSSKPEIHGSGEGLLYVIYTSGSTGMPKGVMMENKPVINRIEWMWNHYGFDPSDVILQKTPNIFDVSVWEIFMPLCKGCRMALCNSAHVYEPELLISDIRQYGITALHFVPGMYTEFLEYLPAAIPMVASLKYVFASGEALSISTVKRHYELLDIPLHNLYGPTEAAVDVSYYETSASDDRVPIGKPIWNIKLYVLDDNLRLQPIGVPGEICIAGKGLAKGYLHRPDITAEKFVPNPFEEGTLLYRTGDIGRWLDDGNIEYTGRKDHQVKIRGFRIELGEIEDNLRKHPSIGDAVVSMQGQEGSRHLVAYYLSHQPVDDVLIRQHLAGLLPPYMIPSFYRRMESFPLTVSGKVDRNALPLFDVDGTAVARSLTAPGDEIEQAIYDVWTEVLGIGATGIDENFFLSGGDSLKAIRLVARVNGQLHAGLRVSHLFRHPSIRELASVAQSNLLLPEAPAAEPLPGLPRYDLPPLVEDAYPLSDIEKGILYYNLTGAAGGMYKDQFCYQVKDPSFDEMTLKKAFALLIRRHPILRTSYDIRNFPEFLHLIYVPAAVEIDVRLEDLSGMSRMEAATCLKEQVRRERAVPFDISSPGLWYMRVFALGNDEYFVLWVFHHAILDGWSNASLLTELVNTYEALKKDPGFVPAPLRTTFKDHIIEQYGARHSPVLRDFWLQELHDHRRTELPFNRTVPSHDQGPKDSDVYTFTLDNGLLDSIAVRTRVSKKVVCLAAFSYLLKLTTGASDIVFGLVGNLRMETEEGDEVLGCFLNTLPFRVQLPPHASFGAILEAVHDRYIRLKAYDKLSFAEVARLSGSEVHGINPVYDIIFNYVDLSALDGLRTDGVQVMDPLVKGFENTNTFFDFTIIAGPREDKVAMIFSPDIYDREDLKRIEHYYTSLLRGFLDPAGLPESTEVLPASEMNDLLYRFNDTVQAYPSHRLIHQLVEEQAEKTPDGTAVITGDKSFSYRELNSRANYLARVLRKEYGVTDGAVVALLLDRSEWLLISLLGVLKAGATYLPVDKQLPPQRIDFLIRDSGARLVLTHGAGGYLPPAGVALAPVDLRCSGNAVMGPATSISSAAAAYLMYTSGSTGQPKGVLVSHRSIVNYLWAMDRRLHPDAHDRIMAVTTFSFDISITELMLPLVTGASVILINGMSDPFEVIQRMESMQPTLMQATPTFWSMLRNAGWQGDRRLKCITGGELLNVNLGKFLLANSKELWNFYGPTETTVWSTSRQITCEDHLYSIGAPLDNTTVYVLDDHQHLLPTGVVGEVYIGGDGLAIGYHQRPDLNEEKFLPHPWAPGKKLYRTGDLGRWTADGNIRLQGRKDFQVKVRGYRIELEEIGHAIRKFPGIKDEVVFVRDNQGASDILAYYTASRQIDELELKDWLSAQLPAYMIPHLLVRVEDLPTTSSGKTDFNALRALALSGTIDREEEGPGDEIEEAVAGIWKDVLLFEKIGIHDNFFKAGGDSLKSVRLLNLLNQRFPDSFTIASLFSHATIASQSRMIRRSGPGYSSKEMEMKEIPF
ncbi:amino acid adenylation domain-containing protein [Flavitalea sp. BT771]|uniref:non-ribosomal peptide synthetase n=1 Tax=Flavitalea sp. BT771 TaxID=3063329 RepID=UPI0026E181B7|nr:non-ribosomal peptide synthetase [Flavitalea sp. BT771]MDO6435725.1 amino acid adenylation domain-containing protein [Flavitalea sp. BT771]MDV6224622.1 amino acid adenylation domain-containing protein [Flavitalea sp. BT771]